MMRILLALDGSAHADVARDLVAGIGLPAGSCIRVVSVLEPIDVLLGGPWVPVIPDNAEEIEARALGELDQVVAGARQRFDRPGVAVETAVLRGHPATVIADEARTFRADLLILGTRGHGPFQTLMLGSVSAALIDHAPCPVLIARRPKVDRIVLAHDGSAFAESAANLLRDWPLFTTAEVDVVSVMPRRVIWAPALPNAAAESEAWERIGRENLRRHEEIAATAVRDLRFAGCTARPVVLEGHPALEISEFARRADIDLIVLGTRGRTGLTRLMLGSVARSLVTHVPCSILVVRPQPAERRRELRVPADGLVATGLGIVRANRRRPRRPNSPASIQHEHGLAGARQHEGSTT